MRRLTAAFLLNILVISTNSVAAEQSALSDLAGVYLSSGCSLQLLADSSFSIDCPSRPLRRGTVFVVEGTLVLLTRNATLRNGDQPAVIFWSQPQPQTGDSTWPPSLADPTKGPFVIDTARYGDSSWRDTSWLKPLRWGSRLYLVDADDEGALCRAISNGLEPRKGPMGVHFLRRGDHRKPAGRTLPAAFSGSQAVKRHPPNVH